MFYSQLQQARPQQLLIESVLRVVIPEMGIHAYRVYKVVRPARHLTADTVIAASAATDSNIFARNDIRKDYLTMVSSRSGPTEMIFTGTPVAFSINST